MPRYFFDIHDGQEFYSDPEGHECPNGEDIRLEVIRTLPEIARGRIPSRAEDTQAFTVIVRNEARETVYTATLTFAGLWMNKPVSIR